MESCTDKPPTPGAGQSLVLGLILITLAVGVMASRHAASEARSRHASWQRQEVARIQAHLAGAEELLHDADISRLSQDQRRARQINVARLQEYRQSGQFPRNQKYPDGRRPCFVDDRGVHCAMAYLLAKSGRSDLVARVHATNNYAYIRELASDTALEAWLTNSGLSLDEAARIQPEYDFDWYYNEPISSAYAIGSAAASLFNGAVTTWNLTAPTTTAIPRGTGLLGVMSGGVSIILAATHFEGQGDQQTLARWNFAVGALTVGVGMFTLFRSGPDTSQDDAGGSGEPSRSNGRFALTLSPMLGHVSGAQVQLDF